MARLINTRFDYYLLTSIFCSCLELLLTVTANVDNATIAIFWPFVCEKFLRRHVYCVIRRGYSVRLPSCGHMQRNMKSGGWG
jgi:hypothetical protein